MLQPMHHASPSTSRAGRLAGAFDAIADFCLRYSLTVHLGTARCVAQQEIDSSIQMQRLAKADTGGVE